MASSVVSVGSISAAVSASIRATSTATFPLPTTTTRSDGEVEREILMVRVAVVPGHERGRRPRAGEVLAGDVHSPVGLCPEGVDDRVVELGQLVVSKVTADLDVAEKAEARTLRDALEGARDGLDLRVVGRNAEPDEPPRGRQPIEHVHLDGRIVAREERSGRVEPCRSRADHRHTKGMLGGHASRIMTAGCGHGGSGSSERDEACLRHRCGDRRRRPRRRRVRLARLGLVGEPSAGDLQRNGLRDPRRRRQAARGADGGARDARDERCLGRRPARPRRHPAAPVHADRPGRPRPACVRADGGGALLRRHAAGARAPGPTGRPRRGDASQQKRRRRGDDPLARRRSPERRGRRRRRDAERGPPGRDLRLPLPRRAGRNLLVPHPPVLVRRGAPWALRPARDRAGHRCRAREWARRRHRRLDPYARQHTARERDRWRRAAHDARGHTGSAPADQHRQRPAQPRSRRHAVSRRRDRRHRPERSDAAAWDDARPRRGRALRRHLHDAGATGEARRRGHQPRAWR